MVNFILYELNLNFKSVEKKGEWRRFPPLQDSADRVPVIRNSCTPCGECECFVSANSEAHVHPNPVRHLT